MPAADTPPAILSEDGSPATAGPTGAVPARRKGPSAFLADESGATAIEYGLIAALIFLAIVTSVRGVGPAISGSLQPIVNTLAGQK